MTFVVKVRTSPGALMTADYECPVHGRFEALVPRDAAGDPPGEASCPAASWIEEVEVEHATSMACEQEPGPPCGLPSPWRISCAPVHTQFVISATQGRSSAKPHNNTMDTRLIAEGRKNDFRRQRKKLREELRHKRVKEMLR